MTFLYCVLGLIAEMILCVIILRIEKAIYSRSERAKHPYSGVSVERLVSRRACADGGQAETEGNAAISREAPQARAANT